MPLLQKREKLQHTSLCGDRGFGEMRERPPFSERKSKRSLTRGRPHHHAHRPATTVTPQWHLRLWGTLSRSRLSVSENGCSSQGHKQTQLKTPKGFRIEASKTEHISGKMFIGGLSRNTSKEALFDDLSQYGKIIDFTIKTHPETGVSRGFGFVLFEDKEAVEKVLQVKESRAGSLILERLRPWN